MTAHNQTLHEFAKTNGTQLKFQPGMGFGIFSFTCVHKVQFVSFFVLVCKCFYHHFSAHCSYFILKYFSVITSVDCLVLRAIRPCLCAFVCAGTVWLQMFHQNSSLRMHFMVLSIVDLSIFYSNILANINLFCVLFFICWACVEMCICCVCLLIYTFVCSTVKFCQWQACSIQKEIGVQRVLERVQHSVSHIGMLSFHS